MNDNNTTHETDEAKEDAANGIIEDVTNNYNPSIALTNEGNNIHKHRYNLRPARDRNYSKHIGKVNARDDYIFM